ncbi:hypothetical protein [Labrenzia sp. PHM005]|uniref:hypothetical protein n=1 Tax=Labrenzia sp. PHM005 TaxID=2590016 RepID=UPI0011401C63|nr:hypothetical protein [Labrenzia sp. PHM005]QDG74549.1 hypothetical protein FJ695_00935 [Labrenzia sp. PHM005]
MARQGFNAAQTGWSRVIAASAMFGMTVIVSLPAEAQSRRANTTTMSCGQVQSFIAQRGAAVMSTGQHTFDRYVEHRGFCQHNEFAKVDYVPTKDVGRCAVRRCVSVTPKRFTR